MVDTDALLLLAIGFHHRAIGFDRRLIEKLVGLLLPDFQTSLIDPLHELHDFEGIKSSAEISGGGWIWNPLGSQSVQIGFVGSAKFNVLQARPPGQQVHRDVEDMVRFVIGQVQLENRRGLIDVLSQVELLDELHDDADTTA